jgi:hypothetical protein
MFFVGLFVGFWWLLCVERRLSQLRKGIEACVFCWFLD